MISIDKNNKVLNDNDMELLQKKCDNFISSQTPTLDKDNINFYFREYMDLKDPLMHNIVMGLESYIKTKLYTNLELKSMWINKIDINSNKDDNFHKDISPCSLILYLNDDYGMGETLFFNKHGKIIGEVKPEKGKIVCFDGSIFHSIKWIPKGRRIVFVSTFI